MKPQRIPSLSAHSLKGRGSYAVRHPGWHERASVAYQLGGTFSLDDPEHAAVWFRRCIQLAKKSTTSPLGSLRYESYGRQALGDLYAQKGDLAQAQRLLESARRLKVKIGDRLSIANLLRSLAELQLRRSSGNIEQAIQWLTEAKNTFNEVGADSRLLATCRSLGVAYERLGYRGADGAYDRALAAYREALGLVDAAADPRWYGVILHDLADVHRAQGDLEEAARLFREAADRKRQGDASARDQVTTLRALGVTCEDLGRRGAQGAYDRALAAYREALGLVDAAADPRRYGVILHDLADVHRAQGDLEEAARLFREAADRKRQADGQR